MFNKEIDKLFIDINISIRYLRGLKESSKNLDQEQDVVFYFDKIMSLYENMLAEIDYAFDSELKIDRETKTAKDWSIAKIDDCIEDINDWQIPDNLFQEEDAEEFQFLKNEFVAEWNDLLELLTK